MVIHVDASYDHKNFAISTIISSNGNAKSFFLPMKFQINNIWLKTSQTIAELYGIYAAVNYFKNQPLVIYTDNESVSKMLNGESTPNDKNISAFIEIVKKTCLSRTHAVAICYIPRTQNVDANDISLCLLRSIKKMKAESVPKSTSNTSRVIMIPIDFTKTKKGKLYNIYINADIHITMKGYSYCLSEGCHTSSFNNFQFRDAVNWLRNIRR